MGLGEESGEDVNDETWQRESEIKSLKVKFKVQILNLLTCGI